MISRNMTSSECKDKCEGCGEMGCALLSWRCSPGRQKEPRVSCVRPGEEGGLAGKKGTESSSMASQCGWWSNRAEFSLGMSVEDA